MHALGLQTAQGLRFTESFYWDLNDRTRAFTRARAAENRGAVADMVPAGNYGARAALSEGGGRAWPGRGEASGTVTVARMKAMPTDDDCFGPGRIRADGRKLHPAYLLEAKKPCGEFGRLGPAQGGGDDAGGSGVPAAEGRRLPVREDLVAV